MPTAVVKGCEDLCAKVAGKIHSLYIDCGNILTMCEVLRNTISSTTDMGTEFGAADFRVKDYKDLLPPWLNDRDMDTADDDHQWRAQADDALQSDSGLQGVRESDDLEADVRASGNQAQESRWGDFVFDRALRICGLLHVFNNSLSDSKAAFRHWFKFENMLKEVSRLFSIVTNKDKFVASCCLHTPFAWLADKLSKLVPKFIDWRWGSMQHTLDALLDICRMSIFKRMSYYRNRYHM